MPIPRTASLPALLDDLAAGPVPDVDIADLSLSSSQVVPGGLFLASAGRDRHGLDFLEEAIGRGAAAVAWEPVPGRPAPELPARIPGVAVEALASQAGRIADRFFGQPSAAMQVAGITGTNGKTSTAFFAAQAMEQIGTPCAVMGTLGSGRPHALQPSSLTTQDAVSVHRRLAGFLERDVRHVAMEVSSHGLDQGRVNAVRFGCAAFTNLSRDHLDYHGSLEAYGHAKQTLFTSHEPGCAVVNAGDAWGRRIIAALGPATRLIAIAPEPGAESGEWLAAQDLEALREGLRFRVEGSFGEAQIQSRLVGDFNVSNLLVTLGILLSWGTDLERAARALEKVSAPPGRMETFTAAGGPLVIVDYAHTPDALEKVLQAGRLHAHGKLLVVFGCGGERDAGKRPEMGAIAERLADEIIVTDDNPRREDPDAIVTGILAGIRRPVTVERDRALAIAAALARGSSGDVVIIAGKGHEQYQVTASGRQPFSDREVVRNCLRGAAREADA